MINKFLDTFRNLENELRYENKSVLDYENSLKDTNKQEKLKLCRITRNYLVHQDTNFASVNKEMILFLEQITKEIRLKSKTVKDEYKKIKPVYPTDTLRNILPLCAKNIVPVINKKTKQLVYIIDNEVFIKNLAKGNKKIDIPKKLPKYNYVEKNDRLDNLKGLYVVTTDGTENGEYLGILKI